jgi:formate dehydrogenase subunit gamma
MKDQRQLNSAASILDSPPPAHFLLTKEKTHHHGPSTHRREKSAQKHKVIKTPGGQVEQSIHSDGKLGEKSGQKPLSQKILRFRKSERVLHWAIAIPFLVCYITALVLMIYYNANPLAPYREVFSLIHRISGVCLLVLPLLVVIIYWREYKVYLDNLKEAWKWTFHDLKWLVLSGPAAISKKIKLPDQDKYNAAEKINFMTLTATYPFYILTGLLIWFTQGNLLAWVIHMGMAFYATPLLIGHKFMATINPGTRVGLPGMFSGYVDREWARHHYTKWYWKHFGSDHIDVETAGNNVPSEDNVHSTEKDLPLISQKQGESLKAVRATRKNHEDMPEEALSA